jgi:zinc/manganese transport system substrate-binding protein
MQRRRLLELAALAPLPALAAPPLRVVASFSILADLLREVGGAAVEVASLVGPDADAHVYQPSPTDARRLAAADLVVVNGLGFEGWLDRLVRASGYRGRVAVASEGVTPRRIGAGPDPHAWQDLGLARRYVANLGRALAALRPAAAADTTARATAYLTRLDALDRRVRERLARVPRERRRVVTSHDAFGYFGAAYGIDFLAPQGMSTDSEASAAAVAGLIRQIRREGVRAVFVENVTDPRLIERIAREGGVKVGGRLYSDALSAPGGPADSYLKLFAHNAEAIATALGA